MDKWLKTVVSDTRPTQLKVKENIDEPEPLLSMSVADSILEN